MNKNISSELKILDLQLYRHLGITKQEQHNKQPIKVNISIQRNTPPLGCLSDDIENTLCYDKICNLITQESSKKTYNLIEHVCYDILELLKNYIKKYILTKNLNIETKLFVSVSKNPPIENLLQAVFSLKTEINNQDIN